MTVKPCQLSQHNTIQDPDYDNLQQRDDDDSSLQDGHSSESEDEEELNGIVLRMCFLILALCKF